MSAHLIENEAGFLAAYYYPEQHAKKHLPSTYPCILVLIDQEGGVGGPYIEHRVIDFPEGISDPALFFQGFLLALPICL
jgi:hypothetical protein